jgi:hypothetical protein
LYRRAPRKLGFARPLSLPAMAESDNRPFWNGKPGRYEPWFLTMGDGRTGYWIRYTLHAPTGAPPEARLWFARFDRDRPERVFGINRGFPIDEAAVRPEPFGVRIGGATLASGHARGKLAGDGHDVSWDLRWETGGETHRLLPDALYRRGLAPTRPYCPNPDIRYTGTVTVDGERHELDGMPGQQGHQDGTRHAERWAWAHCAAFDEGDAVLHALVAQGKRGPFTLPFTTYVSVRWQGRWLRFSKTSRRRDFALGAWRIDVGDRRYRLSGRVQVRPELLLQTRYLDPDGSERWCHNSEVASARLVLFERRNEGFEEIALLESNGTTAAEWAGRTAAPGDFRRHVEVTLPEAEEGVAAVEPKDAAEEAPAEAEEAAGASEETPVAPDEGPVAAEDPPPPD